MSILRADDLVEPGAGLADIAPPEIPDDVAQRGERLDGFFVPPPPGGRAPETRLEMKDTAQGRSSPPAPMLVGIRQQSVPREDAQRGGDGPAM